MTTTPPPPGDMPPPQPAPQYPQTYAPQPMLESEARTMSMLAHLLTVVLGFISPLIFWLIYRERSALVDFHGKEQLNFQISLFIYYIGIMIVGTITFGIGYVLLLPLGIVALVLIILAAMAANRGEYYRIALNIRFIS